MLPIRRSEMGANFARLTMMVSAFVCLAMLIGCVSPTSFQSARIEQLIVPAIRWGGTPADTSMARTHTISRITLHHQGETFPPGKDAAQYLRDLQKWSRATKKWVDVPYHYAIDLDGNIYQGRDIAFAGDTNTAYDPAGHALIEVVGNYEEAEPNAAQLDAVVALMTLLAAKYSVPVELIRGHRDYASDTVCPGKNMQRYLENGYFRERVRKNLSSMN